MQAHLGEAGLSPFSTRLSHPRFAAPASQLSALWQFLPLIISDQDVDNRWMDGICCSKALTEAGTHSSTLGNIYF